MITDLLEFVDTLWENLKELFIFIWDMLTALPSLIQSVLFFLPSNVSVMLGTVLSVLIIIVLVRYVRGAK